MDVAHPELSIILPTYKEKENLTILIPQIEAEFRDTAHEIIIVDDHSDDGTRELVQHLDEQYHNVVLLERPGLFGIGSALRDGYNKARGEYILSSDADLSFTTDDMRKIFDYIRTGADLVIGIRTDASGKKYSLKGWFENHLISPMSNRIIGLVSGVGLKNYNTNFRIIRSSVWTRIRTVENRQFFLFEMIIRAKQAGAKIGETPVAFAPRQFGESKVSFFKQAPKYFLQLLRIVFFDKG